MRYLKLGLRNFVKVAYKYDIEELNDFHDIDTSMIKVEEHEINELREKFNLSEQFVNNERICESIKTAKRWAYERSYFSEYYQGVIDTIEEKIKSDFDRLNNFFNMQEEVTANGKLSIKKIDWTNDEIVFEGKISKLETYIINAINGYGLFHYDSLEEFKYVNGGNVKSRVEGHIHWLKHIEEIYGTIYDFFTLNLEHVDYYGTLGSTEFDDDEIREALLEEGIDIKIA